MLIFCKFLALDLLWLLFSFKFTVAAVVGIYHFNVWRILTNSVAFPGICSSFTGSIIQNCNWDLLREIIMCRLIPEVMFCGSVVVPATVALKQVDSR